MGNRKGPEDGHGQYFFTDGTPTSMGQAIKMGRTNLTWRRLGDLQTGNPRPFILLGFVPIGSMEAAKVVEGELREVWKRRKMPVGKEWYDMSLAEVTAQLEALRKRFPA